MISDWSSPHVYSGIEMMDYSSGIITGVTPPVIVVTDMTYDGIIRNAYDLTNTSLRFENQGVASGVFGTKLDWKQIVKDCYNATTNKFRYVSVSGGAYSGTGPLDMGQIFRAIHDPQQHALRIVKGLTAKASVGQLDTDQVIKWCYDKNNRALRVRSIGGPATVSGTKQEWRQVIKACFDHTNGMIRIVE